MEQLNDLSVWDFSDITIFYYFCNHYDKKMWLIAYINSDSYQLIVFILFNFFLVEILILKNIVFVESVIMGYRC